MANSTEELVKICGDLPEDHVQALVSYARALKNGEAELDGDKDWNRILNDPRTAPRLEQLAEESAAEGGVDLMDVDRL
jgi:hypothetical protein